MTQLVLDVVVITASVIALYASIQLWSITRAWSAGLFAIAIAYNVIARTAILFHHAYPCSEFWNEAPLFVTGGYIFSSIAIVLLFHSVISILPKKGK